MLMLIPVLFIVVIATFTIFCLLIYMLAYLKVFLIKVYTFFDIMLLHTAYLIDYSIVQT